jgi:glycosyltransferase involved in cell wall biosynthesis
VIRRVFRAIIRRLPRALRRRLVSLVGRLSRAARTENLLRAAAVSRDVAARHLLVTAASRGRATYPHVLDHNPVRALGPDGAVALAWVLFTQRLDPNDRSHALELYQQVRHEHPAFVPSSRHSIAYVELLLAEGECSRASEELAAFDDTTVAHLLLMAEAISPFKYSAKGLSEEAWLAAVNRVYALDGAAPLALTEDASAAAFDRLVSVAEPAGASLADTSPQVSVAMSSYRPDHRLIGAVRSVAASTWANLEILVLDDASGPGFDPLYAEAEAIDPRVRVIRMERNGGTYRIRNHALQIATGDFVTFHDSDDWMHPHRLERQALHLEANPTVLANATRSTRVTELMEFSHGRNLGAQICEPSLMVRRHETVAAVGYFDPLRKGADAEYRKRIEAATGKPTVLLGDAPLTLQLIVADSLSNADIVRHWFHPDRRVHASCYAQWHRFELAQQRTPTISLEELDGPRRLYAPAHISGETPLSDLDVIFASNWLELGTWGREDHAFMKIIGELLERGYRVGITHVAAYTPIEKMRLALAPTVSRMLNNGDLEWVARDDAVATRVLVARYLPLGHGTPPEPFAITAETLLVTSAARVPRDPARRKAAPAASAEATHAVTAFYRASPTWVREREALAAVLAQLQARQ